MCCWTKWTGCWSGRSSFVRYADDCNVYVRSQRAGERVMAGLRNAAMPAAFEGQRSQETVGSVFGRKFLGYCLWGSPNGELKRAVAPKPLAAFKPRIRRITSNLRSQRGRGRGRLGTICRAGRIISISRRRHGCFASSTNGCGIGCGRCNSNTGGEARRYTANCGHWGRPRAGGADAAILDAGGVTAVSS